MSNNNDGFFIKKKEKPPKTCEDKNMCSTDQKGLRLDKDAVGK